ncbi:PQQ-binding-like beta-propeller repeat protein [Verrucomicrobiota bacterium]
MKRLIIVCLMLLAVGLHAEDAAEIIKASGVKGGLVVCVGAENPDFVVGLHADDPSTSSGQVKYLVHCLDVDQKKVAAARKYIQTKGLYGKVSVNVFDGKNLPYADNLVNLIVIRDPGSGIRDIGKEIERVLAPRGVAMARKGSGLDFTGGDGAESKRPDPEEGLDGWTMYRKPVPPSIDEWTHWKHGADGNVVSKDKLVGPPRYVQWQVGPMWQRHHGMIPSFWNMVSASGRIFYIADEAPMSFSGIPGIWRLSARDAFNGKLLWKRDISAWGPWVWSYWTASHQMRFNHPINIRKRMIAVGDKLYLTLGFNTPVSALDVETGEVLKTYEGSEYADEIVMHKGILYMSVNDRDLKPWPGDGANSKPTSTTDIPCKRVLALDAESGKELWESETFVGTYVGLGRMGAYRHLNLTVSDQGVFIVDEKGVVCLEPLNGKTRWASPRLFTLDPQYKGGHYYNVNLHTIVCYAGLVFVQHPMQQGTGGYNLKTVLQALSPETGKELWRYTGGSTGFQDGPNIFGINGLIWIADDTDLDPASILTMKYRSVEPSGYIALDPKTGAVKKRLSVSDAFDKAVHHHRCYPDKATERYLIFGRRGAEFIKLDGTESSINHWARSGCRQGPMLANGLFYRFPDHCRCFMGFQPRGFYAFASEDSVGLYKERLTDDNPLVKGSAYGNIPKSEIRNPKSAWPTFRHDPMRSSSTPASVPSKLNIAWEKKIGSNISPPVIADGTVYVSRIDEYQIVALDAVSGEEKWTYIADAKVDSPPTIYGELVLFGARNGWVYCLRASDGELVWRFRAAPGDRLIMAFDQLESPWPVNGSVLVKDGKVVFTAGDSSVLDGGVYVYVLDVETGKLIEKKNFSLEQKDTDIRVVGSAFSGILVSSGDSLSVREQKISLSTSLASAKAQSSRDRIPGVSAMNGFFDSQWFNRAQWSAGEATGYLVASDVDAAYYVQAHSYRGNTAYFVPKGGTDAGILGASRDKSKARSDVKYDGVALGRVEGKKKVWEEETFLVCPWSMVVTKENLFTAGFTLVVDKDDPWAAFEGRKGGILTVMDKKTGEKISEYKLESPPVWNGMAAVDGKLFVSCRDGSIVCFSK